MNRNLRQIMREAYIARKAGLSAFVALSSTMDDDDWDVIWHRLMTLSMLDKSLDKYRSQR